MNTAPSFQKVKPKEFTTFELGKQSTDGLPPNPIYLMTRSSIDGSQKFKVPLTRNPVKDFGFTYLEPKMWPSKKQTGFANSRVSTYANPSSQSRLKSQRSSLMTSLKTPPLLKRVMSNNNLNQTQNLDNFESNTEMKDDQTPLIFKNKVGEFRQIGRKCSLADLMSNK